MQLPTQLQEAIENELDQAGFQEIKQAREELTDRYRKHEKRTFMTHESHRYAYIASRLPATYAAVYTVLQEVHNRASAIQIRSLLDLGAGPGTVMWPASEIFLDLEKVTLIEKDPDIMALGKRLSTNHENAVIRAADWQLADLSQPQTFEEHDLITLSYAIGELPPGQVNQLIENCWNKAKKILVIIEPGTPQGFARILAARSQLIALGCHMVAPCPHQVACPMAEAGDWCHFSVRVERSSFHRRIKEGSLGYEDEKFSYIAVAKEPCHLPLTRVLRHPQKRSGHVILTLCTEEGLKVETVSKRRPELYKQARKVEWGSIFPLQDEI